jgi:hypothetical protein
MKTAFYIHFYSNLLHICPFLFHPTYLPHLKLLIHKVVLINAAEI